MKKSLIILSLTALFGASPLYAADNAPVASNDNAAVLAETTGTNVTFFFMGRIGGYEATMDIYNGRGTVYLQGSGERTLRVKSYNGRKLVINAYLKGKLIGYYSGILSNYGIYKGTFFNNNGGKVTFELELTGADY